MPRNIRARIACAKRLPQRLRGTECGLRIKGATMNAKQGAREHADGLRRQLLELSHRIHARPEIGFEEEFACSLLCDTMDAAGFEVTRGTCGLPTAFVARAGRGPVHI